MPIRSKTFKAPHAQTQRQLRTAYDQQRANDPATVERRKLYKSKAWLQLRDVKLTEQPTCEYCAARGLLSSATEVDHWLPVVTHPNLALEIDNCRSSCRPCHSSKTAAERRGRPWRGCGLDGRPLGPRPGWDDRGGYSHASR